MKKEIIILELMQKLGIKTRDLLLADNAINEKGELSLEVYVKGGTRTKDLNYFNENSQAQPDGVIIEREIFPFMTDNFYATVGTGGSYPLYELIERGFILPSEKQLKKLALYYKEYRAIARLLGVSHYTKCACRHHTNSDDSIRYYDFEKKMFYYSKKETPFFMVKKIL